MIEAEIVFYKRDFASVLYILDLGNAQNYIVIVPFKCKKMSSEKVILFI